MFWPWPGDDTETLLFPEIIYMASNQTLVQYMLKNHGGVKGRISVFFHQRGIMILLQGPANLLDLSQPNRISVNVLQSKQSVVLGAVLPVDIIPCSLKQSLIHWKVQLMALFSTAN